METAQITPSQYCTVEEMKELILSSHAIPEEWPTWACCQAAELELLDERVAEVKAMQQGPLRTRQVYSQRGICIGAGGATFFACAFNCVTELRRLGCTLPVELWHLGEGEFDRGMIRAASMLENVKVVDASKVAKIVQPRSLVYWALKPFSVLHSGFNEVLYLDADVVPACNPERIFEAEEYLEHGSVFWPDLPPAGNRDEWLPKVAWENVGLEYRDEPDFESGQFVVNLDKCWREMLITMHLNEHADWVYRFVFGDKSTYHLAWRKMGSEYAMPSRKCDWVKPCIMQFDFAGRLFTQHACQGKADIVKGSQIACLSDPLAPVRSKDRLDKFWSGKIYDWQASSPAERLTAEAIEGLYVYERVGHGTREIRLEAGGVISDGGDSCEKRWSVQREGDEFVLTIVGEAHKRQDVGMMRLRRSDGVWRGAWLWHDHSPVRLRPLGSGRLTRPAWWNIRGGTWDENIFESVVTKNEYGLPARLKPDCSVIDVGSHTGSFAFAVLQRGAARVHCYEPHVQNYELCATNLGLKARRAEVHHAAIWAPGVKSLKIQAGDTNPQNTGGLSCCNHEEDWMPNAELVPAVALDDAIEAAAEDFGRVAILKFDCEGAEFPALFTARRLDLVDFILGEFHEIFPRVGDQAFAPLNGREGTADELKRQLEAQGFNVRLQVTNQQEGSRRRLGLFWAGRPGVQLHY